MLSRLERKALISIQKGFFYLPQIPFRWNLKAGTCYWIKPKGKANTLCWAYVLSFILLGVLIIALVSSFIYRYFSTGFTNYTFTNVVQHSLTAIEMAGAGCIAILGVLFKETMYVLNQLIKLQHDLYSGNLIYK